jgi:hypothetical protein
MQYSIKFLSGIVLVALLISCERPEVKQNGYYPVDSLIQSQIRFLTNSKAELTKKAEIDGAEETISFTPYDTLAWERELDIFLELNVINSPVNKNKYTLESDVKDPNSNLLIRSFTGKDTLPVVYLKVFYLDSPSQVRRIEALYREENALLKGSRLLILEFQEINNKTALTSYSIEGSQKMFLGESVKFSIRGTIAIQ